MTGDDDLLERATRALRSAPPPRADELAAGKARLLAAQRKLGSKRSARTLRWVLPLAAVLVAGSALAATTGQVERAVRAVVELFDGPQEREATQRKRRALKAAPAAVVAPRRDANEARSSSMPESLFPSAPSGRSSAARAPAASPAPSPPARTSAPSEVSRAKRASTARAADGRTRGKAPELFAEPSVESAPIVDAAKAAIDSPPLPSDDLARYREAHRAHFRMRDFATALRAWDAYLRAFPSGVFAIEARYNRAICLVRLDRKAEARAALEPFAEGHVGGGYRRADAAQLLQALE